MNWQALGMLGVVAPAAARQAMRMEEVTLQGRALGLTDGETREVIDAWVAWYRVRPFEFSWDVVERSLSMRGMGQEWRPPKHFERSLAAYEAFGAAMAIVASTASCTQDDLDQLRARVLEAGREVGRQ